MCSSYRCTRADYLCLDVYFRVFVCFSYQGQFVYFVFLVYFLWFVLSCQYKWLPGNTRLWNDLLCVEQDVKLYLLTHFYQTSCHGPNGPWRLELVHNPWQTSHAQYTVRSSHVQHSTHKTPTFRATYRCIPCHDVDDVCCPTLGSLAKLCESSPFCVHIYLQYSLPFNQSRQQKSTCRRSAAVGFHVLSANINTA